jgi:YD repeat-containing protein
MSSRLIHCLMTSVAIIALLLTAAVTHAGSVTYTYDELNRLIRAEYEDGTIIQYIYDGAGNRTALYVNTTPPVTTATPPEEPIIQPNPYP